MRYRLLRQFRSACLEAVPGHDDLWRRLGLGRIEGGKS